MTFDALVDFRVYWRCGEDDLPCLAHGGDARYRAHGQRGQGGMDETRRLQCGLDGVLNVFSEDWALLRQTVLSSAFD